MFGFNDSFFERGLTRAIFKDSGNFPLTREAFTISVITGSNSGKKCSIRIGVGMGSKGQEALEDDLMIFRISSSDAGVKEAICVLLGGRRSEIGEQVRGSDVDSKSDSEHLMVSIFPSKKAAKSLTKFDSLS